MTNGKKYYMHFIVGGQSKHSHHSLPYSFIWRVKWKILICCSFNINVINLIMNDSSSGTSFCEYSSSTFICFRGLISHFAFLTFEFFNFHFFPTNFSDESSSPLVKIVKAFILKRSEVLCQFIIHSLISHGHFLIW